MTELKVRAEVARSLATWHAMVDSRDLSRLPGILDAQVVFRSPVAHRPYSTAPVVTAILSTVIEVFEDFTYHRQLADAEGLNIVLEFSAHIGDRQLKGVDLIRFDERGKIVDFEVMIRPLSGLQALGARMAERLARHLGEQ